MREGRELQLGAAERVGVYRKLASYFKEHFRDDARGMTALLCGTILDNDKGLMGGRRRH